VFLQGALIPIRYLLNGATVVQEDVAEVSYHHVELPAHGVILAEGMAAESYLDSGNRSAFANGGGAVQLHPAFVRGAWSRHACAELVLAGPRLAAARRLLLARAAALGLALTGSPDLRVLADGRPLAATVDGPHWRLRLPPGTRAVRLVSRSWTPAHVHPDEEDMRCLGVALSGLYLDGRQIPLDDSRLSSGWHAAEPGWRWTDGDAGLALGAGGELAFTCALTGTYWARRRRRAGPRRAARELWSGEQERAWPPR
jgi:hypothetical protein